MTKEESNTPLKTTIVIDSGIWHQVGIRSAELKLTKRRFLELALVAALKKEHPGDE